MRQPFYKIFAHKAIIGTEYKLVEESPQEKVVIHNVKAKDKESLETAFDEIQNLILNKKDCIEINYINELYEIEKKYGTQLKNQIHKKPETYLETYTSSMPKDLKEKIN